MPKAATAQASFTSASLSKKMQARFDIPQYYAGCEFSQNFVHFTQGPASFRNGKRYVISTKDNVEAALYRYQFNDEQSYSLLMTPLKMWFLANEGVVVEPAQGVTNITAANPPVVTYTGADTYVNGQDVIITGVEGMTEINGQVGRIANVNVGANTFELSNIDASGYTAYTVGGNAEQIVEITHPYTSGQLFSLQTTQSADTMYIAENSNMPQVLTRTSASVFNLADQSFDFPPFDDENTTTTTLAPAATTGTGINVTASAITGINDDTGFQTTDVGRHIYIDNSGANNGFAVITSRTSTTVVVVDIIEDFGTTSAKTTWRLGAFSDTTGYPTAVGLYEQKLVYGGTTKKPQRLYFSEAGKPNSFRFGTNASDSFNYDIDAGEPSLIRTIKGMKSQLLVGTFDGNHIVRGGEGDEAITPTSVTIKPADGIGTENQIPILKNNEVVFTERGQRTLRSFKFEFTTDNFISEDLNIFSEDITKDKIKQISYQKGRPEVIWCATEVGDEVLILTYKPEQKVIGWGKIKTRAGDKIVSVTNQSRDGDFDQTWVVTKRKILTSTGPNVYTDTYMVEFYEDFFVYVDPLDFYTGENNKDADLTKYRNRLLEQQKQYMHLDCALSYDGSDVGFAANAAVTPAATTGTGINFAATNPVFLAGMVNREIWKKSVTGEEIGRARITTFNSTTSVDCDIILDFDSTDQMAAGDWYLTTDTLINIHHLGVETVGIVTDGAIHPDKTVTGGSITLDYQASVVHIGFKYIGILKTTDLEAGGVIGPAQGSFKNVFQMGIKFIDTLGPKYGTNPYKMDQLYPRNVNSFMNSPPELTTETVQVPYADVNELEKSILIIQELALPCTVGNIVPVVNTRNP